MGQRVIRGEHRDGRTGGAAHLAVTAVGSNKPSADEMINGITIPVAGGHNNQPVPLAGTAVDAAI